MARIVVALGGNALGNTPDEQKQRIDLAAVSLVNLIGGENEIVISHGNGPQVGMINLAFDRANMQDGEIAAMELPECAAMSQGYIGYHLQQGIKKELYRQNLPWHVATVVTQVEVEPKDSAFDHPSKPIGRFYDEQTARRLMGESGLAFCEDAGRGWRRVVPSPRPIDIVEKESILNLLDHEFIVIACGGGGIPVVKNGSGGYTGVSAVIDKDFASAKLAQLVDADLLFILTAVDRVAIYFGKPEEQQLEHITVHEAERYCRENHFAAGSMLPKVQAAIEFVKSGKEKKAVIASLGKTPLALKGLSGTTISA